MIVDFESNPKIQTLVNMLSSLQNKQNKSNKKVKDSPKNGFGSPPHHNGADEGSKLIDFSQFQAETGIKKKQEVILIATKSQMISREI